MEKVLIGIAGWFWLIGGFASAVAIFLLKVIPPELLIQEYIPDFNYTDYAQIVLYMIIGVGILKLKRWALLCGIIAAFYYLINFILLANKYFMVVWLDFSFATIELIILNLPIVKRQFK